MSDLHVVLGASGGLGNAVVRELVRQGKRVRAANRTGQIEAPDSVEKVQMNASDLESTKKACDGASLVYHCVNAPYTKWPEIFPNLTRNIIEAAAAANAKLIFGDNLYMYGSVDGKIHEALPYRSTGRKGSTRIEMANDVMAAHKAGKVQVSIGRVSIGRAPDFFGPHATGAAMGERVFKPALTGGTAFLLGNIDAKHTYSFVDDFARGLIMLAEHDKALGEVWHVPSAETLTTRQFVEKIFNLAGTEPKIKVALKFMLSLMGLFNPMMLELKEMMYEWENDYIVDHSKFVQHFDFTPTPHEEAIRTTLDWFKSKL